MSPWWTPVIKEAIGGFVQDLFLSNNRTRPSRNQTMGESATTSILTFNGRAQRPPDSSCLRDDTTSFSRTTIWHWIRYSLDRAYYSSSLLNWHVLLSGQLFGAEFSTHCIWSFAIHSGEINHDNQLDACITWDDNAKFVDDKLLDDLPVFSSGTASCTWNFLSDGPHHTTCLVGTV